MSIAVPEPRRELEIETNAIYKQIETVRSLGTSGGIILRNAPAILGMALREALAKLGTDPGTPKSVRDHDGWHLYWELPRSGSAIVEHVICSAKGKVLITVELLPATRP